MHLFVSTCFLPHSAGASWGWAVISASNSSSGSSTAWGGNRWTLISILQPRSQSLWRSGTYSCSLRKPVVDQELNPVPFFLWGGRELWLGHNNNNCIFGLWLPLQPLWMEWLWRFVSWGVFVWLHLRWQVPVPHSSWWAKGAVVRSSLDLALVLRGETQVKDPSSSLVLR